MLRVRWLLQYASIILLQPHDALPRKPHRRSTPRRPLVLEEPVVAPEDRHWCRGPNINPGSSRPFQLEGQMLVVLVLQRLPKVGAELPAPAEHLDLKVGLADIRSEGHEVAELLILPLPMISAVQVVGVAVAEEQYRQLVQTAQLQKLSAEPGPGRLSLLHDVPVAGRVVLGDASLGFPQILYTTLDAVEEHLEPPYGPQRVLWDLVKEQESGVGAEAAEVGQRVEDRERLPIPVPSSAPRLSPRSRPSMGGTYTTRHVNSRDKGDLVSAWYLRFHHLICVFSRFGLFKASEASASPVSFKAPHGEIPHGEITYV